MPHGFYIAVLRADCLVRSFLKKRTPAACLLAHRRAGGEPPGARHDAEHSSPKRVVPCGRRTPAVPYGTSRRAARQQPPRERPSAALRKTVCGKPEIYTSNMQTTQPTDYLPITQRTPNGLFLRQNRPTAIALLIVANFYPYFSHRSHRSPTAGNGGGFTGFSPILRQHKQMYKKPCLFSFASIPHHVGRPSCEHGKCEAGFEF